MNWYIYSYGHSNSYWKYLLDIAIYIGSIFSNSYWKYLVSKSNIHYFVQVITPCNSAKLNNEGQDFKPYPFNFKHIKE